MIRKLIVLTGGSSGIGYRLLVQFLKEGYTVLNLSRKLPQVDGSLQKSLVHYSVDLSELRFAEQLRAQLDRLVQLNCVGLIHCAGVGQIKSLEAISDREISSTINVNLTSAIILTKCLLPYLNKRQSKIFFIGSRSRRFAYSGGVAYCAAKAGLLSVTDALSLELRSLGWNIGVSLFEFGTVASGFGQVKPSPRQISTQGASDLIFKFFMQPLDDFDTRVIEIVPSVARLRHE
jgi:short-subunit dehydrogenase